MKITKRTLCAATLAALGSALAGTALAQTYPARAAMPPMPRRRWARRS